MMMKGVRSHFGDCKKHPRYKGIRKPTSTCEMCWRIYVRATGG